MFSGHWGQHKLKTPEMLSLYKVILNVFSNSCLSIFWGVPHQHLRKICLFSCYMLQYVHWLVAKLSMELWTRKWKQLAKRGENAEESWGDCKVGGDNCLWVCHCEWHLSQYTVFWCILERKILISATLNCCKGLCWFSRIVSQKSKWENTGSSF